MKPVAIISSGVIASIGKNVAENLSSLRESRAGIGFPAFLETHWAAEIPVGEVPYSNDELAVIAGVPPHWPRTALLSAIAVAEAWLPFAEGAKILRKGFISANTVGGMDKTEGVYKELKAGTLADMRAVQSHECGAVTALVAQHFELDGFVSTISTACSSSANSIAMAAQLISAGLLDVVVAGGADALCRFTLNGFNTLQILDRQPCQPFDNNRRGLNLGEGAGYVVLASAKAMETLKAFPTGHLSGAANANDAYHQTASSPQGTGNILAMRGALATAGLKPADVSCINLHGTGTPNNDSAEGKAVMEVFGNNVPPASSTKSFTGHTLGAAGGVEAVYSVLSLQHNLVFPNLRWGQQMEDVSFAPQASLMQQPLRHVLSNSFGFGGNCSSLIFSAA